jgi:hypothetical protein
LAGHPRESFAFLVVGTIVLAVLAFGTCVLIANIH